MDMSAEIDPGPMRQYLTALSLYSAWYALAWLSNYLGYTALPRVAAGILLWGILATNLMFFLVAQSKIKYQPPQTTVALAQCVFGIAWATLYAFLSSGAGELTLGMYLTTVLFAVFRIGRRSLFHLAVYSASCYTAVVLAKGFLFPGNASVWTDSIQLITYLGIVTWLLHFGHRLRFISKKSIDDDRLQSVADKMEQPGSDADDDFHTKSFNQRFIMETLAREKGRTDRSNNPFSICIFDIDSFSSIIEEHGSLAGDRILREFSKRVRSELRGMDTMNPTGIERTFGQFSNEEFVAILPHTGLAGAERCAERLSKTIGSQPFDGMQDLTISVGVAEYQRGEKISELLARAEHALHEAMRNGGVAVNRRARKDSQTAQIIELHKLKN
jgi:diguanylate cyclase (GGDEF)-like protein